MNIIASVLLTAAPLGVLLSNLTVPAAAQNAPVPVAVAQNDADIWHFKTEFLPLLVKQIPALLKSQDAKTGRFGGGIWTVNDQHAIFPLAAVWSIQDAANPYYHDPKILAAIMAGGDALIDDQDAKGQWVFRKKDGSTWGKIYMPWTYSRWIRAFGLIKDAMPTERRARWEKALALGFEGIAKSQLTSPHNIPTHHAMALYRAGQVLQRPEWCEQAKAFMQRVVEAQDSGGFWSENLGPVVNYNTVYIDAVGVYYALSGDANVLPALQRAARFHANFTYPNGSAVETVDERNPYHAGTIMPNVGFTFSDEGRGYLRQQWELIKKAATTNLTLNADLAAAYLLYGQEGKLAPTPAQKAQHHFVLGNSDAMVHRQGPWFLALSAYHAPVPKSRWIQDRQNFLSLFHDRTGLLIGGGNTKMQPLWSTFTVGDVALLSHKAGDENPNFVPPAGLIHVPNETRLDAEKLALDLTYGQTSARVQADLSDANKARLIYSVQKVEDQPIAAHLTLLPHIGQKWTTASGKSGVFGDEKIELAAGEIGAWFGGEGWRIHLPPQASITWPVLPHNPYTKDGRAKTGEGRIVITLPFQRDVLQQDVIVEIL